MNQVGQRLAISLLLLRLSVALVFTVWALDKFVQPEHTAKVFAHFYRIDNLSSAASYVVGSAQILLTALFAAGIAKRWTYPAVTILHGISTLSSYRQYLDPFSNLLFFAAWPMLAACVTLWLLQAEDTLVLGKKAWSKT